MNKKDIEALEERARAAVVAQIGEEETEEQEQGEWIVKTYFLGPNPRLRGTRKKTK